MGFVHRDQSRHHHRTYRYGQAIVSARYTTSIEKLKDDAELSSQSAILFALYPGFSFVRPTWTFCISDGLTNTIQLRAFDGMCPKSTIGKLSMISLD